MTVCVAAIANSPMFPSIVAATDKMITAGDLTFESGGSKRFHLTPKIVALGAGDSSDELQICRRAREKIIARGIEGVAEAAHCFSEAYREYRIEVFERELLGPFGLTFADWANGSVQLPSELAARVDRLVRDQWLPMQDRTFGCSTIVAGVDTVSGQLPDFPDFISAHIYVVSDPGQVSCADSEGFIAVGSGARQAESYLMLDGYTVHRAFDHATLSIFSAKRHAENAPGVGAETDLFRIDVTGFGFARSDELKGIEAIYLSDLTSRRKSAERAKQKMSKFMEGMRAQQPVAPPAQETQLQDPASDAEDAATDTSEG